MPRSIRDANLETRTARSRLAVRHKPYMRLIEPGLHLGYRKLAGGPGTWLARRYNGNGAYTVVNLRTADGDIVIADDYSEADGERVLSFAQAQQAAKGPRARAAAGSYSVADTLEDYLRFLEGDGRAPQAIREARCRAEAFIRPELGNVKVAALTTERLRRWREKLVSTAPRLRTRKGEEQKYRPLPDTEDRRRARRASANRIWSILRAALNFAFSNGKVETDIAWRRLKPFRNVDAARLRYLTIAEAKRLVNACNADFRPLVQAALQTGARYGELCRLTVADFNPDSGTVHIRTSKSGKARHVVLTEEGAALFKQLTAGRAGDQSMFAKAWATSQQRRPMQEAVKRAKIKPPISFHGLRHTWASLAIMSGAPLLVVAHNLGHADGRMVEKHYGHLTQSYIADAIRKSAPKFGFRPSNVRAIG